MWPEQENGTGPANSHKAIRLKDTVYSTNHTKWELMISEWSGVSLKGCSHRQQFNCSMSTSHC